MVRKTYCIDDSILWDNSIEASFWHTDYIASFWHTDYITHCGNNGIAFNLEEFHCAEKDVDFTGFLITEDRIKPTKGMMETIL